MNLSSLLHIFIIWTPFPSLFHLIFITYYIILSYKISFFLFITSYCFRSTGASLFIYLFIYHFYKVYFLMHTFVYDIFFCHPPVFCCVFSPFGNWPSNLFSSNLLWVNSFNVIYRCEQFEAEAQVTRLTSPGVDVLAPLVNDVVWDLRVETEIISLLHICRRCLLLWH